MLNSEAQNESFKIAVQWRFVTHLERLRRVLTEHGRKRVEVIAEAASQLSAVNPMHLIGNNTKGGLSIPEYDNDLSGAGVVAIIIASIWVLMGERQDLMGAMIDAWPDLPLMAKLADAPPNSPIRRVIARHKYYGDMSLMESGVL